MKKIVLFIIVISFGITKAQIVNIPDANFKNALLNTNCVDTNGDGQGDVNVDTNNDGEIQVSEAESVIQLFVQSQDISSLEGVQSFTNLVGLYCDNNQLSSLDVSQNTNLEDLRCENNQLSSLNLSQNTNLGELRCYNNQLDSLYVSQNTNLIRLFCFSNQLSSLDVSQNTNLDLLFCDNNQLSSLDVSQNTNLEDLRCGINKLSSLDVSQNTNLLLLFCGNNQLSSLNLSQNTNLGDLWCFNNPNLSCIQVDNVEDANSNDNWVKDDTASYSENCVLAIQDFNRISFTLYPNPVQNILNIDSLEPIDSVRIYSINGRLIKETANTSIDVTELSAGLYITSISIGDKTLTKKFIVN